MDTVTRVQILANAVWISQCDYNLWKVMHLDTVRPDIGKL